MGPLNNLLNTVNSWNTPESGIFKREILSRATNLVVTIPLEITAIAQNILRGVFHTASTVVKIEAKVFAYLTNSERIKEFEANLPGIRDLLRDISNVVAYALGTFVTAVFGVILSPKVNFNLHCNFGLASELRKEIAVDKVEIPAINPETNKKSPDSPITLDEILAEMEEEIFGSEEENFVEEEVIHTKNENVEKKNSDEHAVLKEDAVLEAEENPLKEAFESFINDVKETKMKRENLRKTIDDIFKEDLEDIEDKEEPAANDSATELKPTNIPLDSITPKKVDSETVRVVFDSLLGRGQYHFNPVTMTVTEKHPAENVKDYVTDKLSSVWNRIAH